MACVVADGAGAVQAGGARAAAAAQVLRNPSTDKPGPLQWLMVRELFKLAEHAQRQQPKSLETPVLTNLGPCSG